MADANTDGLVTVPDCIACHKKYAVHGPSGRGLCNDCYEIIKRGIAYTPKEWRIDDWMER